jgi:hypothetical protein
MFRHGGKPAHSGFSWAILLSDEHDFVDVTPAPVFTRFQGLYDGVACLVEMLGGVFIL